MIRTVMSTIAVLLMSSTVFAAPVLKADVVVSGPIVTAADMFDDAGELGSTPLFRAPKPGTSGTVALSAIEAAVSRAGLGAFEASGLVGTRVSRAATVVDETMLADHVTADLRQRGIITAGMSASTVFATPVAPINAEAVAEPIRIVSLRYMPGSGAFSARIAIEGVDLPIDLTGTVELMIDVPHLVGNLPAGAVIGPENVEMRPVPLRFAEASGVAQVQDLVGKALVRQSRDGMMLKPVDVTAPMLVGKNDLVTIYFRKGPMTLTVKGQAITGAAQGGPLQVLNLMSKRVISATAISAGAVEVGADPLVAGL